jgi:nuclear pore complex protein Nup98-Nup96
VPPLSELARYSERQLAAVSDFTVVRSGYGSIRWPGETDVRGLWLASSLRIERGNVVMYRDGPAGAAAEDEDGEHDAIEEEDEARGEDAGRGGVTLRRPPVGVHLNKRAVVTLLEVFPEGSDAVTDAEMAAAGAAFGAELRAHTEGAMGGRFLGYDPEVGEWAFELPHF